VTQIGVNSWQSLSGRATMMLPMYGVALVLGGANCHLAGLLVVAFDEPRNLA
jgi:hypothetical protein